MTRRSLRVSLGGPTRTTANKDVTFSVSAHARSPVEVIEASVAWVQRITVHERTWTYLPSTYSSGWSEPARRYQEQSLFTLPLPNLIGSFMPGPLPPCQVRFETVGVAPTTFLLPHFGDVQNFVEAKLRGGDGTLFRARQRVFVEPAPPSLDDMDPSQIQMAWSQSSSQKASVDLVAPYGYLYGLVEGTARLRAGEAAISPGHLELSLVCRASWPLHYVRFCNSTGKPRQGTKALSWLRYDRLVEETMERIETERVFDLGKFPVPEVAAHSEGAVAFSGRGPRMVAQSTETQEGSIHWSLRGTWRSADHEISAQVPIVMAMAPKRNNDEAGWVSRILQHRAE